MQAYRPRLTFNRSRCATILLASAATLGICADSVAQSPTQRPEAAPAEARPPAPPVGIALEPPANSTIEIRVARRPWLLEKFSKPKTEPSIKMNPPRPPAEIKDPPSMSGQSPPQNAGTWMRRGESIDTRVDRLEAFDQTEPHAAPVLEAPGSKPDYTRNRKPPGTTSSPTVSAPSAGLPGLGGNALRGESHDGETPRDVKTEAANAPSDETSTVPSDVEIRDLKIQRDGTPLENDEKSESESKDSEDSSADPSQSKSPSPSPGKYVGSDTEDDAPDLDYSGFPKSPVRMTRSMQQMKNSLRSCLRYFYARPEIANERSNWGMMHSIMVYGADTKIRVGTRSYSAIAWIAGNNACRGQRILAVQDGRITARSGVGLQGHQAQLLAILSLCNVPVDYTLYADDEKYEVADLVESEMLACKSGEELTFTLIGLAHYLDTNATWESSDGQTWDFERLIREELSQPVVGAACGGTHRLMGFAHALRKRRAEGRPMTGQWKRAELYTRDFVAYTYRLQNRDGSMTTDWFEGREDNGDVDRKIQTTGHMVEWLLTQTPDSHLHDPRLVNAVRFLVNAISREPDRDWKIGPKGHALRSLAMYYERAYASGTAWQSRGVARATTNSRR